MNQQKQRPKPGETGAWMDEPDIGSGEKTPGEHETDAIVRSVPSNRPPAPGQADSQAQREPRS
ncbi:MAG TPA: hypothetical protein VFF16_04115 [Telluria sp.]|nr:hypothetical protein [Telluria sp.]